METAAEWLAAHKTAVAVSCLRSPSSSERVESLLLSHRTSAGLVCSCLQFPALPLPFFTTSLRSSLLYCGVAPPHQPRPPASACSVDSGLLPQAYYFQFVPQQLPPHYYHCCSSPFQQPSLIATAVASADAAQRLSIYSSLWPTSYRGVVGAVRRRPLTFHSRKPKSLHHHYRQPHHHGLLLLLLCHLNQRQQPCRRCHRSTRLRLPSCQPAAPCLLVGFRCRLSDSLSAFLCLPLSVCFIVPSPSPPTQPPTTAITSLAPGSAPLPISCCLPRMREEDPKPGQIGQKQGLIQQQQQGVILSHQRGHRSPTAVDRCRALLPIIYTVLFRVHSLRTTRRGTTRQTNQIVHSTQPGGQLLVAAQRTQQVICIEPRRRRRSTRSMPQSLSSEQAEATK